jgi:transcriptional regulator of acetoin/glycerol metabolism
MQAFPEQAKALDEERKRAKANKYLGPMAAPSKPKAKPKPKPKAKPKAKPRKRVNAQSEKRKIINREYMKLRKVFLKRNPFCVVAEKMLGRKIATRDIHHVRGRAGNLLIASNYWLAVSREGHDWIENHKPEARAQGWLAGPGEWNKPE